MPNVSVCIPTYNREKLLKQTLDSVFAQTYKNFEVVIVDDGSTDGTKQMLENSGYNVRYYWQQNSGDGAARNKLISLAQGKYISFLDSDDLLFPDSLERLIAAMPAGNEDTIVYGAYSAIDENGQKLFRKRRKLYSGEITNHLFENILIHSCGSLIPTKILKEAAGFNTLYTVCSDYDLWLRLSLKYSFVAVNEPVFMRRRHKGNLSRISFRNRNIEYHILEKFYYYGGGKEIIPSGLALKRLGKEQYRAARSAIQESKRQTAINYLKSSLKKYFQIKAFIWLLVAKLKLHPALRLEDISDAEIEKVPFTRKRKQVKDLKIAIDFEPVFVNRYSGFYTFGTGMLKGFSAIEQSPHLVLFYSRKYITAAKEYLKYEIEKLTEEKSLVLKRRHLERLWHYFDSLKLEYMIGHFDVYHCFHHLMPATNNKPRLMTVHDLRRYKLPELYAKSKLGSFEFAVNNADHFLAVSQSTKNDLCSVFGIEPNKVDVTGLATGIEPFEYSEEEKKKHILEMSRMVGQKIDDYLVVFSSPDTRKNLIRTVEAFAQSRKSIADNIKLVILGQLPKREKEFINKLAANHYKNVICSGAVNDLRPWLGCAKGLIFASLYEGFGIPILEGFSCGTPVITSNVSSMPEVGGNAALYVDPYDIDSISNSIVKIANDGQLREKLVKAGKERVREFTWKKTAENILEVYKKLAGI
jgi:glycosyltransferase involved in cell wall biosynthesis/GT2 family glycosyltransferase